MIKIYRNNKLEYKEEDDVIGERVVILTLNTSNVRIERWKNGSKEGEWIWYYENGNIWYKGNFKNGKKEGECIWYHKDGNIWCKENYKNGKIV